MMGFEQSYKIRVADRAWKNRAELGIESGCGIGVPFGLACRTRRFARFMRISAWLSRWCRRYRARRWGWRRRPRYLLSLWPQQRFDKFAAYFIADNMYFGNIVRSYLGEKGRIGNNDCI